MKLKRLSENNDAVETVIAVILMVAITVILAAAIGATVFSQGPEKPASQANIDIESVRAYSDNNNPAVVKFIHSGGNPVNFGNKEMTKVTASVNDSDSFDIDATSLKVLESGSSRNLTLNYNNMTIGSTVKFKVVDVQSGQLICDTDLKF